MANGIVHRDVFPDGSEPDSISWKQWNAQHVIYGPSGEVLSFGAVADGEYVRRVGDEFVGGTPAGGGSVAIYKERVIFSDFVQRSDDAFPQGLTPPLFTSVLVEGMQIYGAIIRVLTVFNDSGATSLRLEYNDGHNYMATHTPTLVDVPNPDDGPISGWLVFTNTEGGLRLTYNGMMFVDDTDPLRASLDGWAEDGTTGVADFYILAGTPQDA